jgi:Phage tail assembly chaperone protein
MGDGRQAMSFFIHYRLSDGEIVGWGDYAEPTPIDENHDIALVDAIDPLPQIEKYDAAAGAIVNKTAEEQRLARLPTLRDVQVAVYAELCRTDQFMIADCPITDDEYQAWRAYRFALRGLAAKRADPVDLINAWHLPPDGIDPIESLRERLKP